MKLYWESYGSGGTPLIVVPGGFGLISMLGELIDNLAGRRRVVAIELQGHGHTLDIDRPFSYEAFGDDIAALIGHLGLERADLLGYSLGGGCCLRAAIQHPDLVRRLALVSVPCRRGGWFPEVLAGFDRMGSAGFAELKQSALYEAWSRVAPDPEAFPALMDKTGDLLRRPYDWSDDVWELAMRTLLVYGDADSIPFAHAAEFFALLGGGLQDAGPDGSARSAAQLAVLPGLTHYDIVQSSQLAAVADRFFSLPWPCLPGLARAYNLFQPVNGIFRRLGGHS
jgi:pimeloyl-ACP methyl ester carboxylesterase